MPEEEGSKYDQREHSEEDTAAKEKKEKAVVAGSIVVLILLIILLILIKQFEILSNFSIDEKKLLTGVAIVGALAVSIPMGVLVSNIRRDKRQLKFKEIERDVIAKNRNIKRSRHDAFGNYGKTGEISEEPEEIRRLVNYDEGILEFRLKKNPFILGKSRTEADGLLKNPGASRIHAKISKEKGGYFLTDLNSTNGTMINGRALAANERIKLAENDEISFAGAIFYFR